MGPNKARTQVITFLSIPQTHLFCEFRIESVALSLAYDNFGRYKLQKQHR